MYWGKKSDSLSKWEPCLANYYNFFWGNWSRWARRM